MEFTTTISIMSKRNNLLALLTKKSCSNFKRMLKTKGGIVINIKVMDKNGWVSVRNPNNKPKTILIRSKMEPKSLQMPSFLPLMLISNIFFFSKKL